MFNVTDSKSESILTKHTWDEGNRSDFKRRANDDQEIHLIFILFHGSVKHFWKVLSKEDNVWFHDCQGDIWTPWTMRDNLMDEFNVLFIYYSATKHHPNFMGWAITHSNNKAIFLEYFKQSAMLWVVWQVKLKRVLSAFDVHVVSLVYK